MDARDLTATAITNITERLLLQRLIVKAGPAFTSSNHAVSCSRAKSACRGRVRA
jgi:hypothetical protein